MIGIAGGHWLDQGLVSDWAVTVDPGHRLG
jgi:hypothetical protein